MIVFALVLVILGLFYYLCIEMTRKFSYWKNKGVPQLNPHMIYGDMTDNILQKKSSGETEAELYFKFKKMGVKHGGIYHFFMPKWIPIDLELIKSVVTTDFQCFPAHFPKMSNTLMFNNLFHMSGEPWKDTRRKLTPTFTSGKMKMMYEILLQKTNGLTDLVGEIVKTGKPTEVKELIARYTTDVIANVGFGIECDSLKDKNSEFFQSGQNLFKRLIPKEPPSLFVLLKMVLGLGGRRGIGDVSDIEDFFRNVVFETVKYRETNKVVRKDFLHLMIQLKNQGSITDLVNENDVLKKSEDKDAMSMEELAGQCMLFFTAGFETSSTTTSYALLELAQNQHIQEKLRKEVRDVLKNQNGLLSYESLNEMTYLDNVVSETLRKYPPLANLPRFCMKSYNIPGTDIVIDPGTMVDIPLLGLQHDPDYFPEPEKFIPDRFNAENKHKIIGGTYLPFGEGPRQCLGLRFGLMQTKTALAALIQRFEFTLNKKTQYPPEFDPLAPVLSVKGGIWLDAKEAN